MQRVYMAALHTDTCMWLHEILHEIQVNMYGCRTYRYIDMAAVQTDI